MVTNFEDYTDVLTKKEMEFVPTLVWVLSFITEPTKSPKIVKLMKAKNFPDFTGVTLRKMVNVIRKTGALPVMASSKGYWVSYDKDDVQRQVDSMTERANSIKACANGLRTFL